MENQVKNALLGLQFVAGTAGWIAYVAIANKQSGTLNGPSSIYVNFWTAFIASVWALVVLTWRLAVFPPNSLNGWKHILVPTWNWTRIMFAFIFVFSGFSVFVCYLVQPYERSAAPWGILWLIPSAIVFHDEFKSSKEAGTGFRLRGESEVSGQQQEKCCSSGSWTYYCCTKAVWAQRCTACIWLLLLVFGLSVASQAIATASEWNQYQIIGTLHTITLDTGVEMQLNIHCDGTRAASAPVFVLLAGGGAPGINLIGIQEELVSAGHRACWIDRAGYGWSPTGPLPATNNQVQNYLKLLLQAADEQPPYIMVGHSAGVEISLQYAFLNPTDMSGLVFLDGYTDYITLTRNSTGTPSRLTSESNNAALSRVLDIVRGLAPLGWSRGLVGGSQNFKPEEYAGYNTALYRNNRLWQAQWQEIATLVWFQGKCGTSRASDQCYDFEEQMGVTYDNGVTIYPNSLGSLPVLVIPAAFTVARDSDGSLLSCEQLDLTGSACTKQIADGNQYYLQSVSFATTLTSRGNLTICPHPCEHSFPYEKPEYVASQILNWYPQ